MFNLEQKEAMAKKLNCSEKVIEELRNGDIDILDLGGDSKAIFYKDITGTGIPGLTFIEMRDNDSSFMLKEMFMGGTATEKYEELIKED